ncbi:MAG: capsule assembly Wzi family protein [Spirochaetaceae bacterium]|nr:capsule assembly Wzi family protein [Spirochaetaceae bacterium]
MKLHKFFVISIFFLLSGFSLLAGQEALKSVEEEYYNFLFLQGITERSYLAYRTLSDSVWVLPEGMSHPWENNYLGEQRKLTEKVALKIYGPELFTSFNSAAPYGQNDGVLWQGRGFNASLTGGVRLEAYGIELTVKPQVTFSQNRSFKPMTSSYDSKYGYFWGYEQNEGIDAPQRFGNKVFFDWSLGDTEIRYTWKNLTIGFGTQAVWLGPAYMNPMLHSNNAAPYPKLDIGLRRTSATIPKLGWYIGDIEFRIWTGYLSESDYFDNDSSNDHNMIHGLAFSYAPSFLPGLVLSVNRTCLVKWDWRNLRYIIPLEKNTEEDQKMSLAAIWSFPQAGFEVYGEMGLDDFVPDGVLGYIRYPFHTLIYTLGLKKNVSFSPSVKGQIIFEYSNFEMSQDFQFQWAYNFYFHHQITQGYTNRGQFIGAGLGSGGNSQFLGFNLYYPKGSTLFFINRNNPDNNYIYKNAINESAKGGELGKQNWSKWKTNFILGVSTVYFINSQIQITGQFAYDLLINPAYTNTHGTAPKGQDVFIHNFCLSAGCKFIF